MTLDKSTARIQEMFGEIAGRYDFLNRLLSLGIDQSWRRKTVKPCRRWAMRRSSMSAPARPIWRWPTGGRRRAKRPWLARTSACRCSRSGERKCRRAGAIGQITLLQADTLHLPFPDDVFQIVSVAFGLRNLSDTDAGLREMARVCQPGGRVAILEFSTPTAWPLGAMYGWYFRHVLPQIGQALARNSQAAYNYLPQSVGQFPQGEALAERMRAAGLGEVKYWPFTFGVATLYVGRKV